MKRLLSLALCFIVAVTFISCSSEPAVKFSRGIWEGDVYTSEFLDLTFTKPDNWVIATDEEMEQLFGISMDMFDSEDMSDAAKQQVIFDMLVSDPETNSNISFMFQNLAVVKGGKAITEEQFAKSLEEQASALEGVTYKAGELQTIKFGENEYKYVNSTLTMQGVEMNQTAIIRKVGNYIFNATVTATAAGGETVEEILAMFS